MHVIITVFTQWDVLLLTSEYYYGFFKIIIDVIPDAPNSYLSNISSIENCQQLCHLPIDADVWFYCLFSASAEPHISNELKHQPVLVWKTLGLPHMQQRSRTLAGAAGELSSPGSIFCADSIQWKRFEEKWTFWTQWGESFFFFF